jgi:hypothetical protein
MDPIYWSPTLPSDYASVVSFSAALVMLAACLWELRLYPTRAVTIGGAAASLGLFTAGVANLLEDGFGLRALGIVYVTAILVGTLALIPTGVGLARASRPGWIALGPLLSFPGLIFVATESWGTATLATTWIALGALHGLGRLRLSVRDSASG